MIVILLVFGGLAVAALLYFVTQSPKTTAQHDAAKKGPALYDLLAVRDFLDNIMVRLDGSYVAGYRIGGALTYFGDDDTRNETKTMIEALLRTVPEESMRIQFRYEVVGTTNGQINRYTAFRRTEHPAAIQLDEDRERIWQEKERVGDFLTRIAGIYFIWNPDKHRRMMAANDVAQARKKTANNGLQFTLSKKKAVERERKEHEEILAQFESVMMGVQASLANAGLQPERLSHPELFLEIKRALCPLEPDAVPLKDNTLSLRYISAREQLADVSILEEQDSYINIDGILWSCITMKVPPDATYPGIIRDLLTTGFPMVISTQMLIPNQQCVLDHYKKRYKKMTAALIDTKGGRRIDVSAQVSAQELLDIQERIIASSVKTLRLSLTVAVRTSEPARTNTEYEDAQRQLANRRQAILHVLGRMNGAAGLTEGKKAQERLLLGTLPGLAEEDKREHDLLTPHAADLVPVEMPWAGTPRSPLMLFETPYRQLLPFSPFDPGLENANAIIAATSGTGKSVLVGQMLLRCARQDIQVSIIERGDSYYPAVEYMGGQMITMSLDSDQTINPFDLDPGESMPTNDHMAFLKNLTRFMIGDGGKTDSDLLDNIITTAMKKTYERAAMRLTNKIPTYSDLRDELQNYNDEHNNEDVNREARLAATKLGIWVDNGMYAKLFDRSTTVSMDTPWLYFNIEQLKDDLRLETAMSLLIAYATTKRAMGKSGKRSIIVLDECWALLQSPSLGPVVVQLFRTARKRNACIWGVSQAVEDFTGTPEKPNEFGGAILATTAIKIIGRQKGNLDVLRRFVHLNETTINHIKQLGMTEKGVKSEFVICIGENAETTHRVYVVTTSREYWLLTTFPRERHFRSWWHDTHRQMSIPDRYAALAEKYPRGISALDELPEERSGEVYGRKTDRRTNMDDILEPEILSIIADSIHLDEAQL
jgi:hypothetical protein